MILNKRFIVALFVVATSCISVADCNEDESTLEGRRLFSTFEPYKPSALIGDKQVCNSCADVPCGECQQGCKRSDCPNTPRNNCKITNYNQFPKHCVDADGDTYDPRAFIYSTAHPCCGYGTGGSECKYFDFEICGKKVCNSCEDVPCGMCQQGCKRTDCTNEEALETKSKTRNACQEQEEQEAEVPNFGFFPTSCAKKYTVGNFNTVCGPWELMSYQECVEAAEAKITERSPEVHYFPRYKADDRPPGCSFRKDDKDRFVAWYNAKWENADEDEWQTYGNPGKANKRFKPVCLVL